MHTAEEKLCFAHLFETAMDFKQKEIIDMASKETYHHF